MISSLTPLIKALTWTIGSIFFLQNIGVQMTAIWALLSAGGIGAGLALKDPVQEFFEYITILLDKPFQKGEFIKSDGVLGRVERVGGKILKDKKYQWRSNCNEQQRSNKWDNFKLCTNGKKEVSA